MLYNRVLYDKHIPKYNLMVKNHRIHALYFLFQSNRRDIFFKSSFFSLELLFFVFFFFVVVVYISNNNPNYL